jgi:hypothetical protein
MNRPLQGLPVRAVRRCRDNVAILSLARSRDNVAIVCRMPLPGINQVREQARAQPTTQRDS